MNIVVLVGRLTRDPEVRYSQGDESIAIARCTLAVDKGYKVRDGEPAVDFIPCVALGKRGEFAEKYLRKGTKVAVTGKIQTGSYTNKDGQKVYTTNILINTQEFAESKAAAGQQGSPVSSPAPEVDADGFLNIPDGIDEELPFS